MEALLIAVALVCCCLVLGYQMWQIRKLEKAIDWLTERITELEKHEL